VQTVYYLLLLNTYRLPDRPPKKHLTHMKSHEEVYTLIGAPVYMLKTPYMLTTAYNVTAAYAQTTAYMHITAYMQ
jgi:hypothetical protein